MKTEKGSFLKSNSFITKATRENTLTSKAVN